jgi:hypothetical protein
MLRHLVALPILLLSLLAAVVPTLACAEAAPTQQCCPNGPNAPCAPDRATTAEANRLDFCCATGGTIATTTAIATPSDEFRKAWDRADLPAVLVVLLTLTAAYVLSPALDDSHFVSPPLSDTTLYLSTGRLRL